MRLPIPLTSCTIAISDAQLLCLRRAGELSEELASSRASAILELLSKTLEENATLKLSRLLNDTDTGQSGKATRSQLEIRMNDTKKTVNSLEVAVAQGVAIARTLTSSLRAIANEKKPTLQLVYMQAAVKSTLHSTSSFG